MGTVALLERREGHGVMKCCDDPDVYTVGAKMLEPAVTGQEVEKHPGWDTHTLSDIHRGVNVSGLREETRDNDPRA